MTEELKPCPFCGCEHPKVLNAMGEWWVLCPSCKVSTDTRNYKEPAIAAWNRRTQASECRNVRPDRNSFKCSECGGAWYGVGDAIARPYPKHCPNCGRRIVEVDS